MDLINAIETSCWTQCAKTLIALLRAVPKESYETFLNKKRFPGMSDRERYLAMCNFLVTHINFPSDDYTLNPSLFLEQLISVMDQSFALLEDPFKKGSYTKMVDAFNRVLLPKDEDDADFTEGLRRYVLNVAEIRKQLKRYRDEGYEIIERNGEVDTFMLSKSCGQVVLGLTYDKHCILLLPPTATSEETEIRLTDNEFLTLLDNPVVPSTNYYTNLESLKRDFINRQEQAFRAHSSYLHQFGGFRFYNASYKYESDFNDYDELRLTNAINNFPVNYEDYSKQAFAVFNFTKTPEGVTVNSQWIVTEELPDSVKELYTWKEIFPEEFFFSLDGSEVMLH